MRKLDDLHQPRSEMATIAAGVFLAIGLLLAGSASRSDASGVGPVSAIASSDESADANPDRSRSASEAGAGFGPLTASDLLSNLPAEPGRSRSDSAGGLDYIALNDEILSGSIHARSIRIPADVAVRAAADLELDSETDIVVEGSLVGAAGSSIRLIARDRIIITGELRPGDGVAGTAVGASGRPGGDLVLEARHIWCDHDLVGGRGGDGGPGGDGAMGGSIRLDGLMLVLGPDGLPATFEGTAEAALFAGDGGNGGNGNLTLLDGGRGGNGGVVLQTSRRNQTESGSSTEPGDDGDAPRAAGENGYDSFSADGFPGFDGAPCQNGRPGSSGFSAFAGDGGDGGDGADAGPPATIAGNGGAGGNGGEAIGGDGGYGGKGGDCAGSCSLGGTGGLGAGGTTAWGGAGGRGGTGGNGTDVGVDGGHGGVGGWGGDAWAGDAGDGGDGGNCCDAPDDSGVGGDGAKGGDSDLTRAVGGIGGRGGAGGRGYSDTDTGGNGADGGDSGAAHASDAGDGGWGGDGDIDVGDGGEAGKKGQLTVYDGGIGGIGGWPGGSNADDGSRGTEHPPLEADDGDPGDLCGSEEDADEEDYSDGSFEDAYSWDADVMAGPDIGAFASHFSDPRPITGLRLSLSRIASPEPQTVDAFIWDDAGGVPGPVLCVSSIDIPSVAEWPLVSRHFVSLECESHPTDFWAGYWGVPTDDAIRLFVAADLDGPGGGTPVTNVPPGLEFPEGWQPVSEVFGPTAALGISVRFDGSGACCRPDECCVIRTQEDCERDGGTFAGVGTNCLDGIAPCAVGTETFTHETGELSLTVTNQGIVGSLTEGGGPGLVFPAGGQNQLYVASPWVAEDASAVSNRDYAADPETEWERTSCPSAAFEIFESNGELRATTHFEDASGYTVKQISHSFPGPGPEGRVVLLSSIMKNQHDTAKAVIGGMFADFDLGDSALDDQAAVLGEMVYMTDDSGIYLGIVPLGPVAIDGELHPLAIANATVVSNEQYVFPNQFISDEDKWGFLSAADPDHTLLEGDGNDFSALVSVGPYLLEPGQTLSTAFAFCAGNTFEELLEAADWARQWYQPAAADVEGESVVSFVGTLSCAPNPSSGPVTISLGAPVESAASISIHDAAGRQVRALGYFEGIGNTVVWDGRSDAGDSLAPGVYFVRAESAGIVQQTRIVRLR